MCVCVLIWARWSGAGRVDEVVDSGVMLPAGALASGKLFAACFFLHREQQARVRNRGRGAVRRRRAANLWARLGP